MVRGDRARSRGRRKQDADGRPPDARATDRGATQAQRQASKGAARPARPASPEPNRRPNAGGAGADRTPDGGQVGLGAAQRPAGVKRSGPTADRRQSASRAEQRPGYDTAAEPTARTAAKWWQCEKGAAGQIASATTTSTRTKAKAAEGQDKARPSETRATRRTPRAREAVRPQGLPQPSNPRDRHGIADQPTTQPRPPDRLPRPHPSAAANISRIPRKVSSNPSYHQAASNHPPSRSRPPRKVEGRVWPTQT
ncbi:hypothetical protein SAMN05421748_117101 [Paractinoplanes atraurantiacus]|uniref:Uncharacterized protein n=1 Tax=Paractinoplanes atraurantiacus TaxID=1036182 RepID=A0A285J7M6_9ACTN|nr:hypothetical protein SAMN05421748_117101 [Actinoplanes atraurantiacus]